MLLLLPLLLFLSITSTKAQTPTDPTGGYGPCTLCVLLNNPKQLTPCSSAWRQLVSVCQSPACSAYATYLSKAPPLSSCTSTPDPLPGGSASVGFSFGTWSTVSRGTPSATGSGGFTSVKRSTLAEPTGTGTTRTGIGSGGGSDRTTGMGTMVTDTATRGGVSSEVTPTSTVPPRASGGAGRVVAGSVGAGWLYEAVFLFWGAVW